MSVKKLTFTGGNFRVVIRFFAQRVLSSALIWAVVFGLFVFSSAQGLLTAFPTTTSRMMMAASFGGNVGLKVLLGMPYQIYTVGGFTEWRAGGIAVLIGGLWGAMTATRLFRGDEDEGRTELILASVTTPRWSAIQTIIGASLGFLGFLGVTFILTYLTARMHDVGFGVHASFYFSLSMLAGAIMFFSLGAFFSQIASSRRQALLFTMLIFGLSFALRSISLVVSSQSTWWGNISPFTWVTNLQPLTAFAPQWFWPIGLLSLISLLCTILITGWRDMGVGLIHEKTTAKSHSVGLRNSLAFALRQSSSSVIGWSLAALFVGGVFGSITKTAAQSFQDSQSLQRILAKVASLSQNGELFLGFIFMTFMIIVMIMTILQVGGIREEEASGRLDTLLVSPTTRTGWLFGKTLIIALQILWIGILMGMTTWFFAHTQGLDLSRLKLFWAGVNVAIPALTLLGIGVLSFALLPRLGGFLLYALVAFTFIIQFLTALFAIPQWVLDISLLEHMNLAPAADPNWSVNGEMLLFGLGCVLLGLFIFTWRDTQSE